ncbi:kinase-like domain-containing protein, partial [Crassisporium funariophilum]
RKRNPNLWRSKPEEVSTMQSRSGDSFTTHGLPAGELTTFKFIRSELLERGIYGYMYLGGNASSRDKICIKQVELQQREDDKDDSRQHTAIQALKTECKTLKDLHHPNIVKYLGSEETSTNLTMFLEYLPDASIGSCIQKYGKLNDSVTRSFTTQILNGLAYLHSKAIIHRNLRADNILVDMNGRCKISQFGTSARMEDVHETELKGIRGIVYWMAPEIVNTQNKGYNLKVDIWGVGCVALEMWTGMRPWMDEEMVAVMIKVRLTSKHPPPVHEDVVLSEEADDFRMKCFAIAPEERPSAKELQKHPYLLLPSGWLFTGF